MRDLVIVVFTIVLLGACATNNSSTESKAGILCIKKTDGSEEVVHCLNPLSAPAEHVNERVALHNAVNKSEDHIRCSFKQKLGSRFTRWRCYYMNRPDVDLDTATGLLDLIDKGNRL